MCIWVNLSVTERTTSAWIWNKKRLSADSRFLCAEKQADRQGGSDKTGNVGG